ncbi:uncharacterized protein A4U43_C08F24770 [Asparagus officinalis]|nr:uncharacterized protein A4U43_C08F24770 [Asparagus officinalis]
MGGGAVLALLVKSWCRVSVPGAATCIKGVVMWTTGRRWVRYGRACAVLVQIESSDGVDVVGVVARSVKRRRAVMRFWVEWSSDIDVGERDRIVDQRWCSPADEASAAASRCKSGASKVHVSADLVGLVEC